MAHGKQNTALGAAYAATRPEEVAALYDSWSQTYDADMSAAGYRHPTICLALLARHLPRGSAPLLDAGAGTGLIGEWLAITGYPQVEALDISQGMLDQAARKGVYSAFHCLAPGGRLHFADNSYAGIVSAGVSTWGHVGAEGLDELIRICRPGGIVVLTVKNTLWDAGFAARIAELDTQGIVIRVEETAPYVSMPGEADTVPSRCLALRVS